MIVEDIEVAGISDTKMILLFEKQGMKANKNGLSETKATLEKPCK